MQTIHASSASTGPCTGVHGENPDTPPAQRLMAGFNGAVHRSARRGDKRHLPAHPCRCGFNGAVHRSARREGSSISSVESLRTASTGPCTGVHGERSNRPWMWRGKRVLQRGRAPECTERPGMILMHQPGHHASTGPCTGVHGEREKERCPERACPGFNGAVHRSARRVSPHGACKIKGSSSTSREVALGSS